MPDNPFKRLQPRDGFYVERVDLPPVGTPTSVSLHGCVRMEDERANLFDVDPDEATVELATWREAQPADLGAAKRLELVLESICRYLNTGGNWNEFDEVLRRLRKVARGGLLFPGFHLLDSYLNTEGNFEHIFVKTGTNKAVLWVEGQFIERKTLEEILHEQEEAGWEEGTDRETPSPPQLLGQDDPGDEGPADDAPDPGVP